MNEGEDYFEDYEEPEEEVDEVSVESSQGVVVGSLEEGYKYLREFAPEHIGDMAFCLLMEHEGVLRAFPRTNQPCYGEMRPYGKECDRPNDGRPSDLFNPFPDGTPVAVSLSMYTRQSSAESHDFLNVILDKDKSPWRAALKDYEVLTKSHSGLVVTEGILFKDLHVPSTLFINLWLTLRNLHDSRGLEVWGHLRKTLPDEDPNKLLLAMCAVKKFDGHYSAPTGSDTKFILRWDADYYISQKVNVKNFLSGNYEFTGLLSDRSAYNRPELQYVFGRGNASLTTDLLKKLSAEKQFTSQYGSLFMSRSQLEENFLNPFFKQIDSLRGASDETPTAS